MLLVGQLFVRTANFLGFGSRIRPDEFFMQHGIYDYRLQDYEADLLTLRRGRTKERKVRMCRYVFVLEAKPILRIAPR